MTYTWFGNLDSIKVHAVRFVTVSKSLWVLERLPPLTVIFLNDLISEAVGWAALEQSCGLDLSDCFLPGS